MYNVLISTLHVVRAWRDLGKRLKSIKHEAQQDYILTSGQTHSSFSVVLIAGEYNPSDR